MRRHWFYILLVLADGDRHGSAIMREVLALTDGELKLWPATLYGSLEELRQEGWIRTTHGPPDESGLKRFFRITPDGRRALRAEVRLLQTTARMAAARLGLSRHA